MIDLPTPRRHRWLPCPPQVAAILLILGGSVALGQTVTLLGPFLRDADPASSAPARVVMGSQAVLGLIAKNAPESTRFRWTASAGRCTPEESTALSTVLTVPDHECEVRIQAVAWVDGRAVAQTREWLLQVVPAPPPSKPRSISVDLLAGAWDQRHNLSVSNVGSQKLLLLTNGTYGSTAPMESIGFDAATVLTLRYHGLTAGKLILQIECFDGSGRFLDHLSGKLGEVSFATPSGGRELRIADYIPTETPGIARFRPKLWLAERAREVILDQAALVQQPASAPSSVAATRPGQPNPRTGSERPPPDNPDLDLLASVWEFKDHLKATRQTEGIRLTLEGAEYGSAAPLTTFAFDQVTELSIRYDGLEAGFLDVQLEFFDEHGVWRNDLAPRFKKASFSASSGTQRLNLRALAPEGLGAGQLARPKLWVRDGAPGVTIRALTVALAPQALAPTPDSRTPLRPGVDLTRMPWNTGVQRNSPAKPLVLTCPPGVAETAVPDRSVPYHPNTSIVIHYSGLDAGFVRIQLEPFDGLGRRLDDPETGQKVLDLHPPRGAKRVQAADLLPKDDRMRSFRPKLWFMNSASKIRFEEFSVATD